MESEACYSEINVEALDFLLDPYNSGNNAIPFTTLARECLLG